LIFAKTGCILISFKEFDFLLVKQILYSAVQILRSLSTSVIRH